MHLHGDFKGVTPAGVRLARALNQSTALDGAYARVIPVSAYSVLKATSCSMTNALFSRLHELSNAGSAPLGLPAVLRRHGACVRMAEADGGALCQVWEVERLFAASDEAGRAQARVLGRKAIGRAKPEYLRAVVRLVERCETAVFAAVTEEASLLAGTTWEDSARLMTAMTSRTEGSIRDAFLFLEQFIRELKAEADLLNPSNMLLDMFGRPVLSDPVAEQAAPYARPEELTQFCAVALVPTALLPSFQVQLEPKSTLGLSKEAAVSAAEELKALGLSTSVMSWGTPEHAQTLRRGQQVASLWSMPKAAQLIENPAVISALLTC